MRTLSLAVAIAAATFLVPAVQADAAPKRSSKTMNAKLQDGREVRYRTMKVGGQMMVLVPIQDFRSVFSRN